MNSPSGRGRWWSNICQTIQLIFLFQQAFDLKWVPYNKLHVSNYRKVHHDKMSDAVVLKVESQKNTYIRAIWSKFLADSNELLRIRDKENNPIHARFAGVTRRTY